MSHAHAHQYDGPTDALQSEPTRTLTIRRGYARDLRGALSRIRAAIRQGVADEDVFGLESLAAYTRADDALVEPPSGFDFDRNADKERAFDTWLDNQLRNDILREHRGGNEYLHRSYERGLKDADRDLRRVGIVEAGETSPVEGVLRRPVHRDQLEAIYTRNYRQLEGFTSRIGQETGRVLAEGLSAGENPNSIARDLTDVIGKVEDGTPRGAHARATTIARTEILNSHHESSLTRYEEYDVDQVTIELAGDACDRCISVKNGEPYGTNELRGLVPVHPRCRCAVTIYNLN